VDLDAQRATIERRLAAPVAAPELLERQGSGLVQPRGGNLGDVLDTLTIAEAHDAVARLTHTRMIARFIRLVFACGFRLPSD